MKENDDELLILALDDPAATLARVGGKGASLAQLASSGLPVPAGFHVTTAAYEAFVLANDLQSRVLDAFSTVSLDRPASGAGAAEAIARLFVEQPVPREVADAVIAAYRKLGGDRPAVAVRSSATAEDLPELSFAGQQETYLNVRGEADLLAAVKRCWASLWTERALSYRLQHSVPSETVRLAVVVQRMVPADAAGVMFTVDPVSGASDRVMINAAWGLGEAVVAGRVTPDTLVVDKLSGAVLTATVNDKSVRTVVAPTGTHEVPVPERQRRQAVLSRAEAAELAGLGVRIESEYRYPVDVEWAREDRRFWILQARPITGLPHDSRPADPWNDSLAVDALWTRGNIGEAVPDVVTPCSKSLLDIVFHDMMPTLYLGGYAPVGYIGGRAYLNLSILMTMLAAAGQGRRRLIQATGDLFGQIPDEVEIPVLPVSRWTVFTTMLPATVRNRRRIRGNVGRLDAFLATAATRCDDLLGQIRSAGSPAELTACWHADLLPHLHECNLMLEAGSKRHGGDFLRIRRTLRRLVGEADTNALLLAAGPDSSGADSSGLASLGPLEGLQQLMSGQIDRATFVRRYGHHSPHLFEISYPRPGEDPGWIDQQIAALGAAGVDVSDLLERQEAARRVAWERFRHRYPGKAVGMQRRLARARASTREREAARSEQARVFWPLRAFVRRAGELTGHGEQLFYLTIEEILALLDGDGSALDAVPERREVHARYAALPPYPALIRGHFDPFAWAADPLRRSDLFDPGASSAPVGAVRGFPGSPGIAEGRVRVVTDRRGGGRTRARRDSRHHPHQRRLDPALPARRRDRHRHRRPALARRDRGSRAGNSGGRRLRRRHQTPAYRRPGPVGRDDGNRCAPRSG